MQKNYAIDKVDERDFDVEVLLGYTGEDLPKRVFIKDNQVQDQSLDNFTLMACVFFTGSSISNTMNYLAEEYDQYISGKDLSKIAIEKKLLDTEVGAFVIDSPKLLQELGYIKSYARCKTVLQVKVSLAFNRPVQTGTQNISWVKTIKNNNIAVEGKGYGHSFFICGYDDDKQYFICENSYGKEKYDDGYFYLRYIDFHLLFNSKYTMTDKPRENYDKQIFDNIELEGAKSAFVNGFWNGLEQHQPIKRGEAATMAQRAYEKAIEDFKKIANV